MIGQYQRAWFPVGNSLLSTLPVANTYGSESDTVTGKIHY